MSRAVDDVVQAMRSLERSYLIGVEGVTEIWLVRHADVYDTLDDVDDPPLSVRGREQARRLRDRIQKVGASAVYASPARRARQTAEGLSSDVRIDPRLAEATASFTGARLSIEESAESVILRMHAAVDSLVAEQAEGRVIVIGHGIAILTYLADLLGIDPARLRIYPPYTGVSIVRIKAAHRVVATIFDVAHLESMG